MLKIFILKNRSISGIPCILSLQKAILVSRDFDISSPEILGGDHSCRNLKTISSKTNKISKINSKNNKTNRTKTKSKTDNILFIKQTGKETFLSRFVLLCIGSRKRPCAALGGTAIKSQLWICPGPCAKLHTSSAFHIIMTRFRCLNFFTCPNDFTGRTADDSLLKKRDTLLLRLFVISIGHLSIYNGIELSLIHI